MCLYVCIDIQKHIYPSNSIGKRLDEQEPVMVIFGGQGIVGMRDFYFKQSMPNDAFIYKIPKYNGIQFHSGAYAKYCLINP